jgi:hypothetical protein
MFEDVGKRLILIDVLISWASTEWSRVCLVVDE